MHVFGRADVARYTITAPGDWTLSAGNYYHDLDISGFVSTPVVVQCYESDYQIDPLDVQFVGTDARIWMPVNTISLDVAIVG